MTGRTFWRIATNTRSYAADDLSGKGAQLHGGRWNRPGHPVIYCSSSIALACLETVVHLSAGGLPLNRYLVAIKIPEQVFASAPAWNMERIPVGWDALPEGKVSLDWGDRWLESCDCPTLLVPSVIVPEESNLLINPRHKDAAAIEAAVLRKWLYDPRLVQQESPKKG